MPKIKFLMQKTTLDKAILCGLFLLITVVFLYNILNTRYQLFIPRMKVQCMEWSFGVVDYYQKHNVKKGLPYAFKAKNMYIIEDGETIAKYIEGKGFDEVLIDENENIIINNQTKAQGLQMAGTLNQKRDAFMGKGIIERNHYFALGTTYTSYDSRYWGTLDENQILGRLFIIF